MISAICELWTSSSGTFYSNRSSGLHGYESTQVLYEYLRMVDQKDGQPAWSSQITVLAAKRVNRLSEARTQCCWQENSRRAVGNRLKYVPAKLLHVLQKGFDAIFHDNVIGNRIEVIFYDGYERSHVLHTDYGDYRYKELSILLNVLLKTKTLLEEKRRTQKKKSAKHGFKFILNRSN